MLIIAFLKVELTLRPPAWILYKCFICPVDSSMQDGRCVTWVPSSVRAARGTNTETNLSLLSSPWGRGCWGCSAQPRKQRANCPGLIDQNLLKSVAKSFNLLSPSALMDRAGVSKKNYPLIFPLTAGLDNEVKMTLSLIKVICSNH